ncbi:hypothetical protein AMECASPLE_006511 [Ameca splendens]|uniref:Uncharacterized protein n=1 Tax=Ameca splendens TaxID=208324 RepID=A0ABV0XZC3_9TELE
MGQVIGETGHRCGHGLQGQVNQIRDDKDMRRQEQGGDGERPAGNEKSETDTHREERETEKVSADSKVSWSTEANCVPESSQQRPCLYDAKWSSFSQSEERTTGPHHCGYSSNVQFGRPTERAAPPHSYEGFDQVLEGGLTDFRLKQVRFSGGAGAGQVQLIRLISWAVYEEAAPALRCLSVLPLRCITSGSDGVEQRLGVNQFEPIPGLNLWADSSVSLQLTNPVHPPSTSCLARPDHHGG